MIHTVIIIIMVLIKTIVDVMDNIIMDIKVNTIITVVDAKANLIMDNNTHHMADMVTACPLMDLSMDVDAEVIVINMDFQ
jgi:hypothetical protein